jgi:predicted RNA binding protein YcfA (HicA-like mRNA interferase family)
MPVISGERLVKALERSGWEVVRQRGSHVRMKNPARRVSVTIPLHRELKRGTLSGILSDAGIDGERLRQLL